MKDPIDLISQQQEIVQRASEIINAHLSDPNFTSDQLCEHMNIARMRLHRQLINAGSLPPASLIRQLRMAAARQHIRNNYGNVSQIMYAVGFNSPSSFIAAFKKQFGVTPNTMIQMWVNEKRTE